MKNILTIAKWELTRLRFRFGGRLKFVLLAMVLLAIGTSYTVYHLGLVTGKELYTAGVSSDGPAVEDPRFQIIRCDLEQGNILLNQGKLDVYINGKEIIARDDTRSQYVKEALLRYLSRQDLLRIAEQYENNIAFPLRVEVISLARPESGPGGGSPPGNAASPAPGITLVPIPPSPGQIDEVNRQLDIFEAGGLPQLKETLLSKTDVIIPSLTPPLPMAQVILVFSFLVPILFVAVFFAGSFAEERINGKLIVLLSSPVSNIQIILGKMIPYIVYSLLVIIVIALVMSGNILLNLAIFTPVSLLIFSAYMIVALMYRTFKDLSMFSVITISVIMVYMVVPALLTGVSDFSYISPLTLALEIYRGETITVPQYLLATVPLVLVFGSAVFIGTRLFNEEYLMGFKPLHVKASEALNLMVSRNHLNLSAFLATLSMLPVVFVIQLVSIIFVRNAPMPASLWALVIFAAVTEEFAKSAVLFVLIKNGAIGTKSAALRLSALSALGFFAGEKLLLLLAMAVLSGSVFTTAVFGGGLWILPLIVHVVSTGAVGLITYRLGTKYYLPAVIAGAAIHAAYNLFFIGMVR